MMPHERSTEPLRATRKDTRPLEVLRGTQPLLAVLRPPGDWSCARCGGQVEPLSQGHYQSRCLAARQNTGFHFCCPGESPGCELKKH